MSDVRSNKPALPFALGFALALLGFALALTIAGAVEPAQAGSRPHQLDNGVPAASADNGLVQLADNSGPEGDAAEDEPAPEPVSEQVPETVSEPPADQPAAPTMPDATVQQSAETPAVPATALPESRSDYYTERAKETIKEDGKADDKPHPLQAEHPDQNVVVCEGGCPSEKSAQIVFIEPRSARKPIAEGEMIPSSSDASAKAAASSVVTCEAGCYDRMPRTYTGTPGGVASGIPMAAMSGASDSGSWVTTVSPVAASESATSDNAAATKPQMQGGSGEWMNRISKETGQSAKAPASLAQAAKAEVAATVPAPAAQVVAGQSTAEKVAATAPSVEATGAPPVAVSPVPSAPDAKVTMTEVKTAAPESAIVVEPVKAATEADKPVAPTLDLAKADPVKSPIKPVVATPAPATPAAAAADAGSAIETISDAPKPSDAWKTTVAQDAPPSKKSAESAKAPAAVAPTVAPAAVTTPAVTPSILNDKASAEPAAADKAPEELAKSEAPGTTAADDKPAHDANPAVVAPEPQVKSAEVAAEKPAPMQVADLTKPESAAPEAKPATAVEKSHDPVVNIETADAEMAAAMATARANLPEFWSKLEQPAANESDFSLKVAIQGRNAKEVEHFWLTNIVRKNGKITGTISNDPSTVKTVRRGQTYAINPDKISDWLYKRNGKMVGNETMRPLLKRLPIQQAASYREMYEKP